MTNSGFEQTGCGLLGGQFDPAELVGLVTEHDNGSAGKRITSARGLSDWLHQSPAVTAALSLVGQSAVQPVRAVLFDKSPQSNWVLGWHQDRTIAVRQIVEVPGFGPFTSKAGLVHVEPPFEIIERMVTLRFHLDRVDHTNAPLLVIEGSHLLGKIAVSQVHAVADQGVEMACHAEAGDVWVYATPILHASKRSESLARRRVLQVDYSSDDLPGGLEWLGV